MIPIYRAKNIFKDEWVEGSVHYDGVKYTIREQNYDTKIIKIDPSTLVISFDDGEEYFEIEEIVDILEAYEQRLKG